MSTQPVFDFPTYDVSRGRENPASQESNPSDESKAGQRAAILKLIEDRGQQGTTLCDIQRRFGWEKNAFSGRLTELMDDRKLYIFGPKREKCSVYYPVRNA